MIKKKMMEYNLNKKIIILLIKIKNIQKKKKRVFDRRVHESISFFDQQDNLTEKMSLFSEQELIADNTNNKL